MCVCVLHSNHSFSEISSWLIWTVLKQRHFLMSFCFLVVFFLIVFQWERRPKQTLDNSVGIGLCLSVREGRYLNCIYFWLVVSYHSVCFKQRTEKKIWNFFFVLGWQSLKLILKLKHMSKLSLRKYQLIHEKIQSKHCDMMLTSLFVLFLWI